MRLTGWLNRPQSVTLPTFYFPDEALAERPDRAVILDKSTGLARVDLPAGHVALTLTHARPLPVEQYGQWSSALGAALFLLCLLPGWDGNRLRARLPVNAEGVLLIAPAQGNEFTAALP